MTNTIRPIAIALIRRGNEILVFKDHDKTRDHTYYRPLGGGIEFTELGEAALKREFIEELYEAITDVKLMDVFESIFILGGRQRHELVFVYEAAFVNPSVYQRTDLKVIDDPGVEVHWVDVEDFKSRKLTLYPEGLLQLI